MKRMLILIPVLLAIAWAIWAWPRYIARQRPWELSGTIEANTIKVGSIVGGRVAEVLVAEGDKVAAQQPIVRLETDLIDLQLREQAARIAESRAALLEARRGPRHEELERAKIDWQAAETDRKRFAALYADGVIGKRELDGALVREATARQLLQEKQAGTRAERIAQAQAAAQREQERWLLLQRQRRELEVLAPTAAVVETLDLRPGDLIGPNQPVAELLAAGDLWVRVYVPEPELGKIAVGQAVNVFVDSFPGRSFPGKIVDIRDRAEYTPRNIQTSEQRQDQVFGVKVQIAPTTELKAGMAALVQLGG